MTPGLRLHRLSAWYGAAQALFDVDLHVEPGEVLAIVGPNGAGKSTTLKAIAGLLPTRGELIYDGRDLAALRPHERARAGIGWVPEDRRIFTDLTVRENLRVAPRAAGSWDERRLFDLFPNLVAALDRGAGEISGGEQQMLAIARTLVANPRLVLLDEPSEGLAPKIVELMARAVREMQRSGIAVLLSEQNAHFARAVADREIAMHGGRRASVAGDSPRMPPNTALPS